MSQNFFQFLADAPPAGGGLNMIVPMFCVIAIIYFVMIRPQSQRQKKQEAMIKAVKTGDKIVSSSGIHGLVSNVKDTTVIVKIADNVKVEMDKSAIGSVIKRDEPETAAAS